MTWVIKADGMSDVLSDDPKHAIETADELRVMGWKSVRIEDVKNNKVDEDTLRKAARKS